MEKRINGSHVVIFKDNKKEKVFLIFRSDYPVWGLVGGGIEKGESAEKAAMREAHEETGFEIRIVKELGVSSIYKRGKFIRKSYLFEGRKVKGKFIPEFPGCKGRWFDINQLPLKMLKHTKEKILTVAGKSKMPEQTEEKLTDNLHLLFLNPISTIKFLLRIK